MAAGTVTWFNIAKGKISTKPINFGSDTFRSRSRRPRRPSLRRSLGTSTDCRYSDLTNEVPNGSGYTTGRCDAGVCDVDAGDGNVDV